MIKFLAIIACCILSFMNKKNMPDKRDINLLRAGMVFTVAADYCLIIAGFHKLGVFLFCIVQQIYHYRFTNLRRVLYSLAIVAVSAIIFFAFTSFDSTIIMGALYAICILSSVTGAFIACRHKKYPLPVRRIIPLAMCLFLLCDINVALYNIGVLPEYSAWFFWMIWLFYLPSQFLLAVN